MLHISLYTSASFVLITLCFSIQREVFVRGLARSDIDHVEKVLCIRVNRLWHYNQSPQKDCNAISFPDGLTINGVSYVVTCAAFHRGTTPALGHYIAYVRPNGVKWFRMDDAEKTARSPHITPKDMNLVMVFYARV
jgi:hypothetical protein